MAKNRTPVSKKQGRPTPKSSSQKGWIYGTHACLAALENPKRQIHRVLITAKTMAGLESRLSSAQLAKVEVVEGKVLDAILGPEAVHQGIAVETASVPLASLEAFLQTDASRETQLLLALDQVTDPHNVGAIIRSACVFGVGGIILPHQHAPLTSGVLAKAASGALEQVPLFMVGNLVDSLKLLKEHGYWCYGLDEDGIPLHNQEAFGEKVVLILGAEGRGLRDLTKKNCDAMVSIPSAQTFSTLNVSNAAAVALYAFFSQRSDRKT